MTERYSPKHRLVLADIRRQHKAYSRTNNQNYPYLNGKLMTHYSHKHRLVLAELDASTTCSRTDNDSSKLMIFTQAQASAS